MNKLPTTIFLNVFSKIKLVITSNVFTQSAKQNSSDHASKENDWNNGIGERKPLNTGIENMKVFIPTSGPNSVFGTQVTE